MSIAENLQSSWNDPQFKRFLSYMQQLTTELKENTKDLNYVAEKLEEREIKGL